MIVGSKSYKRHESKVTNLLYSSGLGFRYGEAACQLFEQVDKIGYTVP